MLAEEEIQHQQKQLSIYRRNLALYLTQAAHYGGEQAATPLIVNSIAEARDNIQRIKEVLRFSQVAVDDYPDEIPFIRRALDEAILKESSSVSESERSSVLRRAKFASEVLRGAQILWVDDHPNNNIRERQILRTFGVFIDLARSTEEAFEIMEAVRYDLIISDMGRNGVKDEGLKFLKQLERSQLKRPVIFYTVYTPEIWHRAQQAFAITNRPDQLLHYVIDVLERERI